MTLFKAFWASHITAAPSYNRNKTKPNKSVFETYFSDEIITISQNELKMFRTSSRMFSVLNLRDET